MTKVKRPVSIDPIGRYRELLSGDELAALKVSLLNPPPTAIRFNPLKTDAQCMALEFQEKQGWPLQPVPFCADGFTLTGPGIFRDAHLNPGWGISTSRMLLRCCRLNCLNRGKTLFRLSWT